MIQNQHIMGWGVGNPEPAPGVYDFADLDSRIQFIRSSGGVPVITLCCAPDWMKGGKPGHTDWHQLTEAPYREHYGDFAALSATVARRYPDVRHFMVWNEFKGFFDEESNRWDAEGYTDLYNQVYDALKAVDPRIQIGGPYLDMAEPPSPGVSDESRLSGRWGTVDSRTLDAFEYWLARKQGADFVVVDGEATVRKGFTNEFTALERFSAVNRWIRGRTNLPIWWAEWYVASGADWSPERQIALRAAAMIELAGSGARTVLYWNPRPRSDCATCLWTATSDSDGGRPLQFLTQVLQNFARWFSPDTRPEWIATVPEVRALAQPLGAVLVNTTDARVTATIEGDRVTLAPYETRWISSG
jgi:hypothetical protein